MGFRDFVLGQEHTTPDISDLISVASVDSTFPNNTNNWVDVQTYLSTIYADQGLIDAAQLLWTSFTAS